MTTALYNLARMTADPEKIRQYVKEAGAEIISEFRQTFKDGCTEPQFYIKDDAGKCWHLAPFHCRHSQSLTERYGWVRA